MKISVVITTYNGEKFIEEQLGSIRIQSQPADEVIIMDDHSSDGTAGIVGSYINDNHLSDTWKLFKNDGNKGLLQNVQDGVLKSSGDIIFYADQDDVWLNDKIRSMAHEFDAHPDMTLLCAEYKLVDENLNEIKSSFALCKNVIKHGRSCQKRNLQYVYTARNLAAQSMAFRKKMYDEMLRTYTEPFFFFDTMIATYAAATGGFYTLNAPLTLYRQHKNNLSGFVYSFGQISADRYSRSSAIEYQKFLLENRVKMLSKLGHVDDFDQILEATRICQKRQKLMDDADYLEYVKILAKCNRYINKKWIIGDILYKYLK